MIDRDRLSERMNLALVRLELRRALIPLMVLAMGFAVAGAAGYYILMSINGGIGPTHTMRFEVADATGVVPGRAEVRFYGIAAGEITNVNLVHGHAIVTATVADKFGDVYKNAQAAVRPNTALQDMYLDIIDRGSPTAGLAAPNYVVPLNQTQSPVNLADVLNTFQPDVRTQLYNLIDQLGNGLADRGVELRRTFVLLAPFLKVAGNTARQLAVRATLTKQLVHNAGLLASVLASRSSQLHDLITGGTTTLRALATEGGTPLRQAIHVLPQSVAAGIQALLAIYHAEPNLDRALTALKPVARDLPSGLASLTTLARSIDPAVRRLQPPVTKLVPLANELEPFSSRLASSLDYISPQVPDLDTVTREAAECIPWINEFFNWDASMSKFLDNLGPFIRGNGNFSFYTVPTSKSTNTTYGYQCAGGTPIGGIPTPKYKGPPPTP